MTARGIEELFTVVSRLRAAGGIIFRGVENRAELAAVELGEAGQQVAVSFALAVVGGAVLFLAGFTVNLIVAAIFWDTPHRVTALTLFAGLEIATTVGIVFWLRSRWNRFVLFSATREQLRKDCACLHDLLPLHEP